MMGALAQHGRERGGGWSGRLPERATLDASFERRV